MFLSKGWQMRSTEYGIDDLFLKRFSPKQFVKKPLGEKDLCAVLEAAMTAPSCFNEQPWRFVLGEKEDFLEILSTKNAEWATSASMLMLLCSTQTFAYNRKPNRWHAFDSGTAMAFLIFEAYKRGIAVHPMGGFSTERAKEHFGLMGLEPHAVLALGYTEESHTMTPRLGLDEIVIDRRET
ncbi:nitroreductase family protein [Sulfurimonas sp. HSL-1656]|uniref:nitroreductase family protein n=1 Tax=Thiomicrolovo subterrani TaxID=3131934 RepID=UPI0031F8282D